jgi:TolA-binding protein
MKKSFFIILCLIGVFYNAGANSDISLLEEIVRTNTGKIEELEKMISELQKEIAFLKESLGKKIDEEASKGETEALNGKTPEEIIKMACDLIEENSMEEARKLLNSFIKNNPSNIYCGMMMFHIGNSYFQDKDYKNAAIEYMKSYKTNSNGNKSAESLYKLALCFKRLSKIEEARTSLEKLIRDYPGYTELVTKAKKELSSLK